MNNKISKFLKNIVVLFIFISLTNVANAADEMPLIDVEQITTEKLRLSFDNLEGNASFLKITNINNQTVYSEAIKKSNYRKVFDLRILEDGTYNIAIEFEDYTVIQHTIIENNVLTLGTLETKTKPVFEVDGNSVIVRINNIENAEVKVEFSSENNNLLYEKTEITTADFVKKYTLTEVVQGDYIIRVTLNGNTYLQYLTL